MQEGVVDHDQPLVGDHHAPTDVDGQPDLDAVDVAHHAEQALGHLVGDPGHRVARAPAFIDRCAPPNPPAT